MSDLAQKLQENYGTKEDKTVAAEKKEVTAENTIDSALDMVDTFLEADKRSDFPEPDRNEVDDVPEENPEKTLKDIEKEVTESFMGFAKDILNEDYDSAAGKITADIVQKSQVDMSEGEQERIKAKYKKTMMNLKK